MNDLLLHPLTRQAVEKLLAAPPHAVLLSGEEGAGLGTLAVRMGAALQGNAHTVRVVAPDTKGTIPIEAVRELYAATRTKEEGHRVIVIDDADKMSHPAQNALLKLLEEPAGHTMFILTSHRPLQLLPTIRSRLQAIEVRPLDQAASAVMVQHLSKSDPVLTRQLLFLASGRPALLTRLLDDDGLRTAYLQYASHAKAFVSGTAYERLTLMHTLAQDRDTARIVTALAIEMLRVQLKQRVDSQLVERLERLLIVHERIVANGNIKAQLLWASL